MRSFPRKTVARSGSSTLNIMRAWSKKAWLLHGILLASFICSPVQGVTIQNYDVLDGYGNVVETRQYEDWNNNSSEDPGEKSWVYDTQDSDSDGLVDAREIAWGTDPYNPDSDYDGLTDGNELDLLGGIVAGYDPTLWDTNNDGYSDYDHLYADYRVHYPTAGNGQSYYDWDGDGAKNPADSHPMNSSFQGDWNNNGVEDSLETPMDIDGDGHEDFSDSHPADPLLWDDWNNNGVSDEVENSPTYDGDGDGYPNVSDSHPSNPDLWIDWNNNGVNDDAPGEDADGDGTSNSSDSHPSNPQLWDDWNYNNINDHVENDANADADGDGHINANDSHPLDPALWNDRNDNGINDESEGTSDTDGDGYIDANDSHITDPTLWNDRNYNGYNDEIESINSDEDAWADFQDSHPDDSTLWDDWDYDGLSYEAEYLVGSNPTMTDTDGDGLNDGQEVAYNTSPMQMDSDQDGLTDYEELVIYINPILGKHLNPNNAHSISAAYLDHLMVDATDTDGDHIPDAIENFYAPAMDSSNPADALGDLDADFVTNLQEYYNGTRFDGNLAVYDFDRDGITDIQEDYWNGVYPGILDKYSFVDSVEDYDSDGVLNFEEIQLGLDPGDATSHGSTSDLTWVNTQHSTSWAMALTKGDTDGDGLPDIWEHRYFFDLRAVANTAHDPDGDGLTNWQEYQSRRDPRVHDYEPPLSPTGALNTPAGWTGSLWTTTPLEIPNPTRPPVIHDIGTLKDIYLVDNPPQLNTIPPFLERRYAQFSGDQYKTHAWFLLENGRYEGIDESTGQPPGPCFESEPDISSNNLGYDWTPLPSPSTPIAHRRTSYQTIPSPPTNYLHDRSASWSEVRLTMPQGVLADRKIIQEYYRSDEYAKEGVNARRFRFTINNGHHKSSQEINFTVTSEGSFYLIQADPLKSRPLSPSDAAGPRYRKIGLNGVPQADSPPQNQEENDIPADETYVDAYTRTLRHSVTDIWSHSTGTELPLTVRRTSSPEIWSRQGGLRPNERPDRPFGAGFTSNITPSITFVHPSGDQPYRATVVDENGSSRSFVRIRNASNLYEWVPALDEKQDAKTCYDRLVQSTADPRIWTLHKKYGTVCTYEMIFANDQRASNRGMPDGRFGGQVAQAISTDRIAGGSLTCYEYGRMITTQDKLGNQLEYQYNSQMGPGGPIESMIPSVIKDSRRPWLAMYITQNGGRVTSIEGPSGEKIHYGYQTRQIGGQQFNVLTEVKRGAGPSVKYSYVCNEELERDADQTNPFATIYNHVNLASIEDELGRVHSFEYEPAHGTAYEYSNGYEKWIKGQSGSPLLLKKIVRPTAQEINFSGNRNMTYFMNGTVNTNGIVTEVSSLGTGTYTYKFTAPHVFCPVPLSQDASQSVIVSFTRMSIASAAGTEKYEFDPQAAMALKRAEDISGNVTTYDYGDAVTSSSHGLQNLGLLKFDDPTTETHSIHGQLDHAGNKINGIKKYTYHPDLRILTSVTDEKGTRTSYQVAPVTGLRTKETVSDVAGKVLRVTNYQFSDPVFAGFMTKQTVETTGLGPLPSGMPSPVGELRTDFVSDINGRIKKQIVYAGANATLPLVTSYTYTGNGSKRTVTDPRNQTTLFEYDPDTLRLSKVTFPDLTFKALLYDAHGNLKEEINEESVKTFHEYDLLNRRIKTTIDLDGDGLAGPRYTSLTPGSVTSAPVYNGDLVTETSYNDFNLPYLETDVRGVMTAHNYDEVGRRLNTTVNVADPDESKQLFTQYADTDPSTIDWVGGSVFDNAGYKSLRTKDPRGFVTSYEYDKRYRVTKTTLNDTVSGLIIVNKIGYDAVGNAVRQTDALGNVTTTEYDGLGRAVKVVLPSKAGGDSLNVPPAQRSMKYTPSGQIWSTTDEMGQTTFNIYDHAGRPVVTMMPGVLVPGGGNQLVQPQVWQAYNEAGNVIRKTDPLGNLTEAEFDSRNRPEKAIFPAVHDAGTGSTARPETLTEYDALGRVIKVTDPLGRSTETRYDRAGRAYLTIAPPVGSQTHITATTHDAAGNILTVKNAENQTITNTYDALGRLELTQDAENITNHFDYDKAGNRTAVTDGLGQITTFVYDAQKRLIGQTFANQDVWIFGYNAVNKTSQTDAKGIVTTYTYDVRNRLRQVASPDLERTLSYDHAGRLLGVRENGRPQANVAVTYDALGRVESESSLGVQHLYGYDLAGNRIWTAYGTGRTVSTTYDALNRPSTITEAGRTTTYGYDLAGKALVMASGNGQATENVYDELGRLTNRTLFASSTDLTESGVLAEFGWGHDAIGNVTAHAEEWKSNALRPAGLRVTTMLYDEASRLETETVSHTAGGVTTVETTTTYDYDDANNRSHKTVVGGSAAGHWVYTYNEANQLKNWAQYDAPNGTLVKSAGMDYDGNGNRISQEVVGLGGTAALTSQGISYQSLPGSLDDGLSISMKADAGGQSLGATFGSDGHVQVNLATGPASADKLVNQGVTYTALTPHQTGQGATVSLVADAPGQTPAVQVGGNDVVVLLATSQGAKAAGTSQGIFYEAKEAGMAGNDVTVRLEKAAPGESPHAAVQDGNVIVKLPAAGGSPDMLENQGITYTAKAPPQAAQEEVAVSLVADEPGQQASVNVTGGEIKVHLETTEGGNSTAVDQGLAYTAVQSGAAGNVKINLSPAEASEPLSATVENGEINVRLAGDGGARASLELPGFVYEGTEPGTAVNNVIINQGVGDLGDPLRVLAGYDGNTGKVAVDVDLELGLPPRASALWKGVAFTAMEEGPGGNNIRIKISILSQPSYQLRVNKYSGAERVISVSMGTDHLSTVSQIVTKILMVAGDWVLLQTMQRTTPW